MLPFGYAWRNLSRDPARMLQTVAGSALVVLLVMTATAVNQGMAGALSASGSEQNVMLVGAGSEESVQRSEVADRAAGIAEASIRGLETVMNVRAVSPEVVHMTLLSAEQGQTRPSFVRGVTPRALLAHPEVTVTEGRFPAPGEIMVGRLAWKRLNLPRKRLALGRNLTIEDKILPIAGRFSAPGTVLESEVWMDLNDLRTFAQRDSLSTVVMRLEDGAFEDVDLFTKQRIDLELTALRESDYYARLADFFSPIRGMTWLTALLIATGGILGGLNTLYAAFSSRIREVATLQAIGFSRPAVLLSLVQESLMACLGGTLLAAFIALFLLDGITVSFSIGAFSLQVTPIVALTGLLAGALLGLIGAIPPAMRCLLPPLPSALRAPG